MKTAQDLNTLKLFTQELAKNGYSADEIQSELGNLGSSLEEIVGVIEYGPEKVAETQKMSAEFVKPSEMSDEQYWESRIATLSDEDKQKMQKDPEYFQRFVQANERKSPLVEGAKKGLQMAGDKAVILGSNIGNAFTIGGLGWLDKQLGSPSGVEYRKQRLQKDISDIGGTLGGIAKAADVTSDIAGTVGGAIASPITRALTPSVAKAPVGSKLLDRALNYLQRTAVASAGGSMYGGLSSGFDSNFDLEAMKRGAKRGALIAGIIPTVDSSISLGTKAVQAPINVAKKYVPNVLRRFGFASTPEMIADDIAESFGQKSAESVGVAVRQAGEGIKAQLKSQQNALYNEAEKLAGNPTIKMTKKGSELGKTIANIAKNTTKSGKKELAKVWGEIGHTSKNAPNYQQLKTLKSALSDKSANATGTLTKADWKQMQNAVEKDIQRGVGEKAYKALKNADSFYAQQLNNPNSAASALEKLTRGNVSDSELGNRVIKSVTGEAWKASSANKVLSEATPLGLAEPIKNALRSNITTRAQFNRMTPAQRATIYGETLPQAEKAFKSDLATVLEDALGGVSKIVGKAKNINMTPLSRPAVVLTKALGGI